MTANARHSVGSLSLVAGCCIFTTSNLVGHGWEVRPDPVRGLLLASLGMMMCVFAVLVSPAQTRNEAAGLVKAVLILGAFSLLATLAMAVAHPFFDLENQKWGAIPPPGLIFGALYGAVSVAAVIGLEFWEKNAGPICELA